MITLDDRYASMKETKVRHTLEKRKQVGFMDGDDYGTIPFPEGWDFKPVPNDDLGHFHGYLGWAENFERLLDATPVTIDPMEMLCGRLVTFLTNYRSPWPSERFSYKPLIPVFRKYDIAHGIGGEAHLSCDVEYALTVGWGGILGKVRHWKGIHGLAKADFFEAEERTVLAIQKWIRRHVEGVEAMLATETRPEIRETLEKMLEANRACVEGVPRTFREVCQWLAHFNIVSRIYDRDGAGCRLDLVLQPFYDRDIAAGILTEEEATFLVANLLLIDTRYYQLSGCDDDGNDQTNAMSWLVLRAARKLNIAANITVRVHDRIDPAFLRFAVECIFTERRGWPRFCGHKGLMNYARNELPGIDAHVANTRISTGCHWMSIPGREYPMNDIPKINVTLCFQHAFEELVDTDPEPTMDKLFDALRRHIDIAVDATAQGLLFHLDHMHEVLPELVMNLFCRHTLERGLNISQCADFYTLCVDGVGLGTIADSFAAIEQRVVDEKKLTWKQVREACRDDFPDENIRLMLKSSDRYCQGSGRGDKWALAVSRLFTERVKARPMPPHVTLVPGWFSWSSTIHFGSTVGATPDGRKAGTPVTHGANPNPGFRKDGAPTAQAIGIARIQCGYGNTCPLQIEFDPKVSVSEGGIERVEELIKAHFALGGTLININVLDKKTLMEANADPMSHPDLVVRVTGFTAYFATLSPQFRQLVVDRFLDGM